MKARIRLYSNGQFFWHTFTYMRGSIPMEVWVGPYGSVEDVLIAARAWTAR